MPDYFFNNFLVVPFFQLCQSKHFSFLAPSYILSHILCFQPLRSISYDGIPSYNFVWLLV